MTRFEVLKWIHLLGAATWTGGLIVLAALVNTAVKAGLVLVLGGLAIARWASSLLLLALAVSAATLLL